MSAATDPLRAVTDAAEARREAEQALRRAEASYRAALANARRSHTLEQIAQAVGTTRQNVWALTHERGPHMPLPTVDDRIRELARPRGSRRKGWTPEQIARHLKNSGYANCSVEYVRAVLSQQR